MDKRKPVDQKQKADEQAELMEAQGPGRDDAAQNDYYRSQKEVDAAFARRLAAARRKWSRDGSQSTMQSGSPMAARPAPAEPAAQPPQAPAMLPQMAAQVQGLPQAAPQITGMLNPGAMGQPLPGALPQMAIGQLSENPAGAAMGQGMPQANAMAPGMAAASGALDPNGMSMAGADGLNRMALKLLAEEADIQRVFPGFDLESFLASDEAVRDALLQGRSLWSVFASVYGSMVRQQAEAEALERVRSRNDAVPDVLRAGGAAGAAAPDYAGMPSDQFNRLRKQYEEQIRMGKKIKP